MLIKLSIAFGLMALCVLIHATGLTAAIQWLRPRTALERSFWGCNRLLISVAAGAICVHLIEITAWAILYVWIPEIPDLNSAMYFSAATYTTVGYGDLVLPPEWRIVGGVEALTGILMCGWSTAFFFAVISRLYQSRTI